MPGGPVDRPRMRAAALSLLLAAIVVSPAARADWQPVERVETYAVTGQSGIELYMSIGERGPSVGIGRAIAHTNFDLKWSRDYRPQPDGSCVLATARPHLIVTYTLPEPSQSLPAPVQRNWDIFIAGIRDHEKVHGEQIIEMVEAIEAFSVGLTAPDDPGCQKVRQRLQTRLGELSQEQRRRSRAFDEVELRQDGNVHQLVLSLVNG